tara:strand:+ start:209 stop:1132 length:924 start_codon:yes stop_codon:yes gene_type:complete
MFGCGHCVTIVEKPTPQTSTWGKLSSDPELKEKVDFILIEFGVSNGKRYPLPEKYKTVPKYGPFIYLRPPLGTTSESEAKNAINGIEFKTGAEYNRTTPDLKKWIIKTLSTTPHLKVQGQRLNQVKSGMTQSEMIAMREKRKAAQKGGFVSQTPSNVQKVSGNQIQKSSTEQVQVQNVKKSTKIRAKSQNGKKTHQTFVTSGKLPRNLNKFLRNNESDLSPSQTKSSMTRAHIPPTPTKIDAWEQRYKSDETEKPTPQNFIVAPQQGILVQEHNKTLKEMNEAQERGMKVEKPPSRKIQFKSKNKRR